MSSSVDDDHILIDKTLRRRKQEPGGQLCESTTGSGPDHAECSCWGLTPSGVRFQVPQTHDMIRTIFDPRLRKTPVDIATFLTLLSYFWIYFKLPYEWRTPCFLAFFGFWRLAYNVGLGYLLHIQSIRRGIVEFCEKYKLFEHDSSALGKLISDDLQARFNGQNCDVEALPAEFKSWILFRHLVDLVLMSDFVTYFLLGLSCLHRTDHTWIVVFGRIAAGLVLLLFNLWVKVDAHRVVKDFAWYWGDFFFLQDASLTFDGVFELAPHPMYSIGYAGYYGGTLIAASWTLFVASFLAHIAQFAFLLLVENPHIEKTYPSESKHQSQPLASTSPNAMLIFSNFDFTRSSDVIVTALFVTTTLLALLPRSDALSIIVLLLALFWRTLHVVGLGTLLRKQSANKQWTRLFIKYGYNPMDAYREWQSLYNCTTVMSNASFGVLCLCNWTYPFHMPFWLFRYVIGFMLVALQVWTACSVYQELGEFGWFFGDFFLPHKEQKLSYSGIYRYINHPERFAGIAGVWGMVLICNSAAVTFSAFIYSFYNIGFVKFVEMPHMIKLYGVQLLNRQAGLSKTVEKYVWPVLFRIRFLRNIHDTVAFRWDMLENWVTKSVKNLVPQVKGVVSDTQQVLRLTPARITNFVSETVDVDRASYSLTLRKSNFGYGEPISVSWTSDEKRSARDWIGMYRVGNNPSQAVTNVSSSGRWNAIDPKGYSNGQSHIVLCACTRGEVMFSGEQLFWAPGTYELRYHHNDGHTVLSVSEPFTVVVRPHSLNVPLQSLTDELIELAAVCREGHNAVQNPNDELSLGNNLVLARFKNGLFFRYGIAFAPFVIQRTKTASAIAEMLINADRALRDLNIS